MSELPRSRRALESLARRGQNAASRVRKVATDKRQRMTRYAGAGLGTPIARQLSGSLPFIKDMELNEKLKATLTAAVATEFLSGDAEDFAEGAALGALGAYSWETGSILGGLFGDDDDEE